jgi:hypothetical protein
MSAVQVPLLIPVKQYLISTLFCPSITYIPRIPYTIPVSHKLKIQIFMDVTHPRLLYAKSSGSIFPQIFSIYWAPQHIAFKR